MIRYDLICVKGHCFDGWFRDSSAYEYQVAHLQLSCPECGSNHINKQLMAPNLRSSLPNKVEAQQPQQIMEMMRALRKAVVENADYVGEDFAREARRMHYKETKRHSIYGETNIDEAKDLIDEGIEIHPLPILPEDSH